MTHQTSTAPDALAVAVHGLPGVMLYPRTGEAIYRQGDSDDQLFLIVAGYIKLTQVDSDGGERIVGILNHGELFGLRESGGAHEHDAIAKGPAEVYRVAQRDFRGLVERRSDLAWPLMASLIRRQRLAERRLQGVLAQDVRGRLAITLHDLVAHYGGRCAHGYEIDVPLTQQEVAEMVGASRPVVSALLNDWRRAGLLSYTREYICVNDLAALLRLASADPVIDPASK